MWHVIDRFVIHFFAAPGTLLAAAFTFAIPCRKKVGWEWLPKTKKQILVTSALIILACTWAREGWDVAHGQALAKVFTDDLSWLLGLGCGIWGLFRWDSWQ